VTLPRPPASVELLPASLPRIEVALCLRHSALPLVYWKASFSAPLCRTLFAAAHRHGNDQNHEHDGGRDRNHDDASANREYDKNCAHATSFAFDRVSQRTCTTVTSGHSRVALQ
jgi:hypothetical protein